MPEETKNTPALIGRTTDELMELADQMATRGIGELSCSLESHMGLGGLVDFTLKLRCKRKDLGTLLEAVGIRLGA